MLAYCHHAAQYSGGMSIDVALAADAASAATPVLCRKNAAAPRVARQWVRPRSSAMSIDVALSSCRGASRDAFSLPQERGCAGNIVHMSVGESG